MNSILKHPDTEFVSLAGHRVGMRVARIVAARRQRPGAACAVVHGDSRIDDVGERAHAHHRRPRQARRPVKPDIVIDVEVSELVAQRAPGAIRRGDGIVESECERVRNRLGGFALIRAVELEADLQVVRGANCARGIGMRDECEC